MSRAPFFWAGMLTQICARSLHQDALGVDAYVEFVRAGWMSAWITVPMALAGLFIVGLIMWNPKPEDYK